MTTTIYYGEYAERMVGRVQLLINDLTESDIETGDILNYLNDGDLRFCRLTQTARRTVSLTTVANQTEYDLPDDCAGVIMVYYDWPASAGMRKPLQEVPMASVRDSEFWYTDVGIPDAYYQIGAGRTLQLGFSPVTGTAGITIKVETAFGPVVQSSTRNEAGEVMRVDSAVPRAPADFWDALVHWATYQCFLILATKGRPGAMDSAAAYLGMFNGAVAECLKREMTRRLLGARMGACRRPIRGR